MPAHEASKQQMPHGIAIAFIWTMVGVAVWGFLFFIYYQRVTHGKVSVKQFWIVMVSVGLAMVAAVAAMVHHSVFR